MMYGREGITNSCPLSSLHVHGLGNASGRMARRRFRVLSERHFQVFSRRDNSRCFLSHPLLPRSSEVASDPALFLGNQLFQTRGNFLMFQHLTTFNLRQAFFDLADKPLVVTHQTLDCFMHQRFSVASLLQGNTVKFGLQFWRKIYLHAVNVKAPPNSVKAFATNSRLVCSTLFGVLCLSPPGGLELATFWLPRQTVIMKFTLIKSERPET